jgi:hypothetical protein
MGQPIDLTQLFSCQEFHSSADSPDSSRIEPSGAVSTTRNTREPRTSARCAPICQRVSHFGYRPAHHPRSMTATATARPVDLSLPLARPITLTSGPRSHLGTLQDAAILIRDLEPFRQARPVWTARWK